MPGISIGDDKGTIVDFGGPFALLFTHAQALEVLVAICCKQSSDQWCGFFGNLAQRITGQVGAGVFLG